MVQVRAEVEINAPPEKVRALILDFPKYPSWHTAFIKDITPIPTAKPGTALQKGDKIRGNVGGSTIEVEVVSNTPSEFRWCGSIAFGAFAGTHFFEFHESDKTPGATTFVHGEKNHGWASFVLGGWPMRGKIESWYRGFAEDAKAELEK